MCWLKPKKAAKATQGWPLPEEEAACGHASAVEVTAADETCDSVHTTAKTGAGIWGKAAQQAHYRIHSEEWKAKLGTNKKAIVIDLGSIVDAQNRDTSFGPFRGIALIWTCACLLLSLISGLAKAIIEKNYEGITKEEDIPPIILFLQAHGCMTRQEQVVCSDNDSGECPGCRGESMSVKWIVNALKKTGLEIAVFFCSCRTPRTIIDPETMEESRAMDAETPAKGLVNGGPKVTPVYMSPPNFPFISVRPADPSRLFILDRVERGLAKGIQFKKIIHSLHGLVSNDDNPGNVILVHGRKYPKRVVDFLASC